MGQLRGEVRRQKQNLGIQLGIVFFILSNFTSRPPVHGHCFVVNTGYYYFEGIFISRRLSATGIMCSVLVGSRGCFFNSILLVPLKFPHNLFKACIMMSSQTETVEEPVEEEEEPSEEEAEPKEEGDEEEDATVEEEEEKPKTKKVGGVALYSGCGFMFTTTVG